MVGEHRIETGNDTVVYFDGAPGPEHHERIPVGVGEMGLPWLSLRWNEM
jgi:hypothetical protein